MDLNKQVVDLLMYGPYLVTSDQKVQAMLLSLITLVANLPIASPDTISE